MSFSSGLSGEDCGSADDTASKRVTILDSGEAMSRFVREQHLQLLPRSPSGRFHSRAAPSNGLSATQIRLPQSSKSFGSIKAVKRPAAVVGTFVLLCV